LVNDLGVVHVTKKCLCAMFGFLVGSIHIIKDIVYDDNKKIIMEIYQVSVSESQ
jgi:hypothetical protein